MASGFASIHPEQEAVLRSVNVPSDWVMQGWGTFGASAGTHAATGRWGGRLFGRSIDLSWSFPWTREHFDHLIAGGLFPFRRQWPQWRGAKHIHCVYLPPLDGEYREWPGWVRTQVEDLFHDRSGLIGHAPLDQWAADEGQKAMLSDVLGGSERLRKVQVYVGEHVEANRIAAYAYLEENSVRCQFRTLVEFLGGRVLYEPGRPLGAAIGDRETEAPEEWELSHEGNYTRCRLRPIAEWLGKSVNYDAATREVELT